MKINIIKKTKKTAGYVKKIIAGLSCLILVLTLLFAYHNCYQTLGEIKTVEILKKQVALNIVDMKLWKEINKEIEWKKQSLEQGFIERNPFE